MEKRTRLRSHGISSSHIHVGFFDELRPFSITYFDVTSKCIGRQFHARLKRVYQNKRVCRSKKTYMVIRQLHGTFPGLVSELERPEEVHGIDGLRIS